MMAISWAFLIIIVILVGIALCSIYAVVLLLTNEKTRAVLKGLLSVPAVLLVIAVGYYMMMVSPRQESDQTPREEDAGPASEIQAARVTERSSLVSTSSIDVSQGDAKTEDSAKPEPLEETIDLSTSTRPAWIDTEPKLVGNKYEVPIKVGPRQTRQECEARLSEAADIAIDQYVVLRLGEEAKGRVHLPVDFIHEHLLTEEDTFEEWKKYSVGRMVYLHTLMRFDNQVNQQIDEQWRHVVVQRRLALIGISFTALLLMLSIAYTYLKVDLATEGAYRGRIKLALSAIVLTVVAVGIAVAGKMI